MAGSCKGVGRQGRRENSNCKGGEDREDSNCSCEQRGGEKILHNCNRAKRGKARRFKLKPCEQREGEKILTAAKGVERGKKRRF